MKNIFPKSNVTIIDQRISRRKTGIENIFQEFKNGKINILIGTQMAIKGWNLPNVSLIGIIDADNLLHWPDFSANEKAYQNIVQAIGRLGRPGSLMKGKAIIQTFHPKNYIFQSAADLNYANFYQQEIMERKELKYPPFSRLIKITSRDDSLKRLKNASDKIYKNLKIINSNYKDISISPFTDPLVSKIRGVYQKQSLIKLFNAEGRLPAPLAKELFSLPPRWTIDVDPVSIN